MTTTREPFQAPPGREREAPGSYRSVITVSVAVAVTVVHLLVCLVVGIGALEPYGLISSIPVTFWLAVAANVIAVVLLLRDRERPVLLATAVVALTTTMHGTVAFLEPMARFPTAWLHAGYTQYVMDTHTILPELGARFSWPGFFVMTATAIEPLSDSVPELILRFAPLAFTLAYIPPLLVIARLLLPGWRAPWLAVAIFPAVNWVGQDYYAPQSLTFLLALVILALSLTWFSGPSRLWDFKDGLTGRGSLFRPSAPVEESTRPRLLLVLTVTVVLAASAVSHQLTLYVVALQLLTIWAVRRGPVLLISVIAALMAATWLSLGAIDFWLPWFNDVFGDVGNPAAVIDSTLADRTRGNGDHAVVVGTRLVLTAVLMAAAGFGLFRQRRARGGIEATIPLVIAASFALLLFQSYGGEGLLRAFLYASAFIAVAIACSFVPAGTLSIRAAAAFVVVYLAFSPFFLVARYGNESFERVTADDVALAECMYDAAPPGATLASISPHLAWQYTRIDSHPYVYLNGVQFDGVNVADFIELMPSDAPGYLIVTEPQLRFVERYLGAPDGWGDSIVARFADDPRWRAVCTGPVGANGVVYQFVPTAGGPR